MNQDQSFAMPVDYSSSYMDEHDQYLSRRMSSKVEIASKQIKVQRNRYVGNVRQELSDVGS